MSEIYAIGIISLCALPGIALFYYSLYRALSVKCSCGKIIDSGYKFCPHCGIKTEKGLKHGEEIQTYD